MDQLMKFGKNILNKPKATGENSSGSGSNSSASGGNSSSGGNKISLSDPMSLMKQFDKDGDGNITENDFVLAINDLGLGSVGEGPARSAFKKIDKNGNGKIDFSEALALLEIVKDLLPKTANK